MTLHPVHSFSHVQLFATPWTAAHQASLSITNSKSLLKLMSIESVMPCSHLILCCPLLLLPSIFPSNGVFPSESFLHIRWPKYWRFSITPYNEYWKSSTLIGTVNSHLQLLFPSSQTASLCPARHQKQPFHRGLSPRTWGPTCEHLNSDHPTPPLCFPNTRGGAAGFSYYLCSLSLLFQLSNT